MSSIFLIFAKSYDITRMDFTKIFAKKNSYTAIYEIIMSPEYFEIKNKDLRPL